MAKLVIFVMSFVFVLIGANAQAKDRVPQWKSLSLETGEGGSNDHQFKSSSLTIEQNQGKFYYGIETQKHFDASDETDLSTFGMLVGYQPDWTLGVEPRASLSAGIARGTERGSMVSLKLEGDHKLARSFYVTFGIRVLSLQGAKSLSGSYQSTYLGVRILAF